MGEGTYTTGPFLLRGSTKDCVSPRDTISACQSSPSSALATAPQRRCVCQPGWGGEGAGALTVGRELDLRARDRGAERDIFLANVHHPRRLTVRAHMA